MTPHFMVGENEALRGDKPENLEPRGPVVWELQDSETGQGGAVKLSLYGKGRSQRTGIQRRQVSTAQLSKARGTSGFQPYSPKRLLALLQLPSPSSSLPMEPTPASVISL